MKCKKMTVIGKVVEMEEGGRSQLGLGRVLHRSDDVSSKDL